ncbi:hypothetical protein H6F79_19170 [Trichocoleus sp. FACHB-69]|nr:hypothetical protein [Trichocoleus sp. FACHB-69]
MNHLNKLNLQQQQQVLDFARFLAMTKPAGVLGKKLLRFAGAIPADDLNLMAQAIKEGCEQVDLNEW